MRWVCVKEARCLGWFLDCLLGGEVGNGMLGAGTDLGSEMWVFRELLGGWVAWKKFGISEEEEGNWVLLWKRWWKEKEEVGLGVGCCGSLKGF